MSGFSVESLSWLEQPPADHKARVRGLGGEGGRVSGAELTALANYALDLNQLVRLARAAEDSRARIEPGTLSPMRLAVIADATTEYVAPAIAASALRHGVLAELYVPEYGTGMQAIMDPGGALAEFAPNVALVAPDYRSLGLGEPRLDAEQAGRAVDAAISQVRTMVEGLAALGTSNVILQTLPAPPEPWCGHLDRQTPGAVATQIAALNTGLAEIAGQSGVTLFDAAAVADLVGRARWFDHAMWHRAKLPFAMDLIPLYADHVARLLGALRGKARKCLVLDLDNTLLGRGHR